MEFLSYLKRKTGESGGFACLFLCVLAGLLLSCPLTDDGTSLEDQEYEEKAPTDTALQEEDVRNANLKEHFDIVSTFDDLNDWKGTRPANAVDIQTYGDEFPVKTVDGSPSIWQYYSLYEKPGEDPWIGFHGTDNVWLGSGKSLCIDYTDGTDETNRGPSRFGFKIGDSPDDGYDPVHVFFMTKWSRNFFEFEAHDQDSFAHHKFLKTLDISAGFKDVRYWGTFEEHDWVKENGGSTQGLHEYGLNAQVYNYYSYGSIPRREVVMSTVLVTGDDHTGYQSDATIMNQAEVGRPILVNEWFGIEYRVKASSPHGASNGEIEVWVYDRAGRELSHEKLTEIVTLRDGHTEFDHRWNKFVWGGNRFAGSYCDREDPLCEFGEVDHFYIDDVIIHGERIGPEYFSLIFPASD